MPPVPTTRVLHALAAVCYLGLALFAMRVVWPAPASTLARPAELAPEWIGITEADQKLTAALVTRNARTWVRAPWRLFDNGQCYPAPRPATLGEHMFGMGLLGVGPWLVTGDPILTYNATLVLAFWLAALSMYALVYAWTGSWPAAFVGGLVFGFHPMRITGTDHPYVFENAAVPLALWFAHRLFTRGHWRDAAGLTVCIALQTLESFYPLVAFAVIGTTYGLYLSLRCWRRLPVLAPKLVACALASAAVAAAVLGPYLATRATWGGLAAPVTLLHQVADFGYGREAFPGVVLVILALVALADRARGARPTRGYDPRLVFLVCGLAVVAMSVHVIPIPGTDVRLPSLFRLAARWVPGLDAIRGAATISFGTLVPGAFLAGWGVFVLLAGRGVAARALVLGTVTALVCLEVFVPHASLSSFGRSTAMQPFRVRPPERVLALYAVTGQAPVLDVPFRFGRGGFSRMADYTFLSAFHARATSACYNSFRLPVQLAVEDLARRLPDRAAAEALHALGFRTLVEHRIVISRRGIAPVSRIRARPPELVSVEGGPLAAAYRLAATHPVAERFDLLAPGADDAAPRPPALPIAPPEAAVGFRFGNASDTTYRHPPPIEPGSLVVRWWTDAGALVREDRVRGMLPLALAPGGTTVQPLTLAVPSVRGRHTVTVARAAAPDQVLGRAHVRVLPRRKLRR